MSKVVMIMVVMATPLGSKTVYVMTTSDTVGAGEVNETAVPPEDIVVVMVTTEMGVGREVKGAPGAASVAVMVRTVGVAPGSPGRVTVRIVKLTPTDTDTVGVESVADA